MTDEELYVALYYRLKRKNYQGRHDGLQGAITIHSQTCGMIAYLFDVHPDRVAEAIKEQALTEAAPYVGDE